MKTNYHRFVSWAFLCGVLCVSFTLIGCSKKELSLGAMAVGKATLDGVPIEKGEIIFYDVNTREPLGGQILNGAFKVNLLPGEKTVRITASKVTGQTPRDKTNPASGMIDVYTQYIPVEYNQRSTLKATITDGRNDSLTFDLKSKP